MLWGKNRRNRIMKSSAFNRVSKYLLSWEGAAFLFLAYMLFTKIQGDGRYMPLTMMMCICILPVWKRQYWDKTASRIVMFSVLYSIIMSFHSADLSRFFIVYFAICPVFFYIYGKIIVNKVETSDNLIAVWWIIAFLLGAATFWRVGFTGQFVSVQDASERSLYITDESFAMSATALGIFVSLGLTGLGASIYVAKGIIGRIMWIFLFLCSLGVVMYVINRTGLIVAGLVTFAMAYVKGSGQLKRVIPYLLLVLILIVLFINSGIIDNSVYAMYDSRKEQDTFGDRYERWMLGFTYLIRYPFGWGHIKGVFDGYMHNMWLDAGRRGGILCFLLIVSMTYSSAKQVLKLKKGKKTSFSILAIGLYTCFFASSFVEPLLDILPQYLMMFMLLWGMIEEYENKSYRYERQQNKI